MGACLSCLGLRSESDEAERRRLLNENPALLPNGHPNQQYGSWSQAPAHGFPPQNLMSAEEVARERKALNSITRWASDQIVEIFPHRNNLRIAASGFSHAPNQFNDSSDMLGMAQGQGQVSGHGYSHGHGPANGTAANGLSASAHQEILLSMIPGDKSKRSIRIYPASRPGLNSSHQRGNSHAGGSGSVSREVSGRPPNVQSESGQGVLVKLNVDMH